MTNFVRDSTALPTDKVGDVNAYNNPTRQWGTTDANAVFDALDEIRDYLRSGTLDAATTHTIATAVITTANVASAALTAATITAATITHADMIADQSPTVGPELDFKGYQGRWFCGVDVANSPTSRDYVLCGVRGSYSFPDGVTTSSSTTLTSPTGGGFVTALIGSTISGAGIPTGTTITAVGGTTSLTLSAAATITATGVRVTITRSSVQDLLYLKHRGGLSPTFGVGVTPPDGSARLQVSPQDDEPAMGSMRVRVGPSQTGKAVTVHDSGPVDRWWVDKDFYVSGAHSLGAGMVVQGDQTNDRPLLLIDKTKTTTYGFSYPGGNALRFNYLTGAISVFQVGTDGTMFFYESPTIQKNAIFQQGIRLQAEVAAPQITSNQNDYAPTGFTTTSRLLLTSDAARDVTGFGSPASGMMVWVYNIGAQNITLKHQSASSAAANRIIGTAGADVVLTPNRGALISYSAAQTKWLVLTDNL